MKDLTSELVGGMIPHVLKKMFDRAVKEDEAIFVEMNGMTIIMFKNPVG